MSENSWRESDSYNELEPINALLADLAQLPEVESLDDSLPHGGGRRRKAAVALVMIWTSTIALHLFAWSTWIVLGITTLMGIHAVCVLFARPIPVPEPLTDEELAEAPIVSLMVAAKNEEAVITRLVKGLCDLDYPDCRYEVWVIDDNSTDATPRLLEQLTQQYDQLRVFRRPVGAAGGKSGALNQVLPQTKGEIIAVFDADTQVSPDLLRRVLPLFDRPDLGAVQVRKAVSNLSKNLWIQGQVAEMALDSYFQQQRIAIGGIGELRGNGQFLRRQALERCGGWNEETITDDLDLTIRLHLDNWDIDFMMLPSVREEGVTKAIALWHQRNRWAEGGYQRYLDYWQPIFRNRLGSRKSLDLLMFWLTQYFLPTAMVPDVLMAILRNHPLVWSPIGGVSVPLSVLGIAIGLRRIRRSQATGTQPATTGTVPRRFRFGIKTPLQATFGTLYMLHWFPVIASTTARMSFRPKRLKWVKTVHRGEDISA